MDNKQIYNMEWIEIDGNKIHHTAIIFPCVKLGKGNIIGPYTVIGSNGEIRGKHFDEFKGEVIIGDSNVISEHVTIQRPFDNDKATIIGNDNLIMAHSHIGHDVHIGDQCEICTGTIIGGYTIIESGVKLKLGVTVRNRLRIGMKSLIGLGSTVVKNVPADSIEYGNPSKPKMK